MLIRIGTSGSVDNSAKKGDIFIATAAVRDDGTSRQYMPIEFPAIASHDLTENLLKSSRVLGIPTKAGICQSKDSFFGEVEPTRMPVASYLDNKWKAWQSGGVGASEMEAATLFVVGSYRKLRTGALLIIAGDQNREESLTKDEYLESVSTATKNILEASLDIPT